MAKKQKANECPVCGSSNDAWIWEEDSIEFIGHNKKTGCDESSIKFKCDCGHKGTEIFLNSKIVWDKVKKKKTKIKKHDCPYEMYGEPCQCNEDFLENL